MVDIVKPWSILKKPFQTKVFSSNGNFMKNTFGCLKEITVCFRLLCRPNVCEGESVIDLARFVETKLETPI